jgi:hypothetical protein
MCTHPFHDRQSSGRLKSNRQFPSLMNARPDQGCLTSGQVYLNCDSCLVETCVRTGYHIVRTVDWSSLYWNMERIWNCSSTERRSDGLLRRPDGCKLDRTFSTQWMVRAEMHVVWTDGVWSVWRPDGMTRRPNGWNSDRWASGRDDTSSERLTGNRKSSDSKALLNSWIHVKHLLQTSIFV